VYSINQARLNDFDLLFPARRALDGRTIAHSGSWLTLHITGGGPITYSMKPRRNPAVQCMCLVGCASVQVTSHPSAPNLVVFRGSPRALRHAKAVASITPCPQ